MPQDSNVHHGLGYVLYKIEKCHRDFGKKVDEENLDLALEEFELVAPNARLYHDRGLVELLRGNKTKALAYFNQGLALDEKHPLLLLEKSKLLLEKERLPQEEWITLLAQLKQAKLGVRTDAFMIKKYNAQIKAVEVRIHPDFEKTAGPTLQPRCNRP